MATTRIMPLHVGKDRTESAGPLPMLLKSNKKDSFFPFRYWRFALQKHGLGLKSSCCVRSFSFRAFRIIWPKAVKLSIGIIVHLNNIVSFRFI